MTSWNSRIAELPFVVMFFVVVFCFSFCGGCVYVVVVRSLECLVVCFVVVVVFTYML